jgi:hypothetical protein
MFRLWDPIEDKIAVNDTSITTLGIRYHMKMEANMQKYWIY